MSPWTGSTPAGTLTLDGSSRTSALVPHALPGEPLHDLRSDGAGATRDENGHRPAPCCKSKTMADYVGSRRALETGWTAKERPIYATPMDLNTPCRRAGLWQGRCQLGTSMHWRGLSARSFNAIPCFIRRHQFRLAVPLSVWSLQYQISCAGPNVGRGSNLPHSGARAGRSGIGAAQSVPLVRRTAAYREGFRMPARRGRVTQYRGPASESLRRTNPREAGEQLAVYGDLARQRRCREMVSLRLLRVESRR